MEPERTSEESENDSVATAKFRPVYGLALEELFNWLCRHRKVLIAVYLSILAAWIGLILYQVEALFAPELIMPTGFDLTISLLTRVMVIVIFFAVQAAFLFGGGKIRVRPGRTPWHRLIASILIFAALMALLCWGFILAYFQMTARMHAGERPSLGMEQKSSALIENPLPDVLAPIAWHLTIGMWVAWLVVGVLAVRRTQQPIALGRLIVCLLSGSWIEFAVALPIELANRPRDKDCPCESGSWLALVICLPILVWAIGPGLLLLFLRERRNCREDPRHSRRVLLRRSLRGQVPEASH